MGGLKKIYVYCLIRNHCKFFKFQLFSYLYVHVFFLLFCVSATRIGLGKLMDFLDEQCITFTMKNMSNRNNNNNNNNNNNRQQAKKGGANKGKNLRRPPKKPPTQK